MVAILSRRHGVFVFVFDELYLYLYLIRFLPVYLYLYLKLRKKMYLYLYLYLIKRIWPQPCHSAFHPTGLRTKTLRPLYGGHVCSFADFLEEFPSHSEHCHTDIALTIPMSKPNVRLHMRGLVTTRQSYETIFQCEKLGRQGHGFTTQAPSTYGNTRGQRIIGSTHSVWSSKSV